jgi:hypothetical protein
MKKKFALTLTICRIQSCRWGNLFPEYGMMGDYGGPLRCSDFGFGIHPIGNLGLRIWDLTAERMA